MAEREGFAFLDQSRKVPGSATRANPFESHQHQPYKKPNLKTRHFVWRRGRDSNPRWSVSPTNDLANRPLQPLGYLSVSINCNVLWTDTHLFAGKPSIDSLGGRGGIRTLGTVAGSLVFKTSTFNHSVTLPEQG